MSRYIVLAIVLLCSVGLPTGIIFLAQQKKETVVEKTVEVLVPVSEPGPIANANLIVEGNNPKITVKQLNYDVLQIVQLVGGVNSLSVSLAISQLETVRRAGYKEALLVIDSPGGSVVDGAELIAYMNASSLQVSTYCKSLCASMGAHILQAGKKRYAGEKALVMFHPAKGGLQGTLEEMSSLLRTINKYVDRFDQAAVKRSKMSYEEFKKLSRDELWLDGVDALRLGFVDELALVVPRNGVLEDALQFQHQNKETDNGRINSLRTFN